MSRIGRNKLFIFFVLTTSLLVSAKERGRVDVVYPLSGALFPPDLAPPAFLWRDTSPEARFWEIEIRLPGGKKPIRVRSQGPAPQMGSIDARCAEAGAIPPPIPPDEQNAHSWRPTKEEWQAIRQASVAQPLRVRFRGFAAEGSRKVLSEGEVEVRTSADPVGAPIFYRDVPLIPVPVGERGVINPLPPAAVPLIAWRMKYIHEPGNRKMMEGLPTCANCHSFSRDGKTLGLDVDGPQNDKGLYGLIPVRPHTSIRNEFILQWSRFRDEKAQKRFGFMSQVSPDGQFVVTSVEAPGSRKGKGLDNRLFNGFYKDYGFGQVFFPTKGVLAWYSKRTGRLETIPGANDPKYVQAGAFWSPDGKWLVYSRAEAKEPYAADQKLPEFANDPKETQIRYDLYRIPFNEGRGGVPERIEGASENGMSNNFPKVSPDGKWIVFVKNRNGLLMRPDSELWIVPFQGGPARKLKANLSRMNSWHSFSPNGRWLVFSSKGRSLYTELFLTHIDDAGNDTPPVRIENATAANRAANIPEFVNIGEDQMLTMDAPATDFYQVCDRATTLAQKGQFAESIAEWRKAVALDPDDAKARFNLAVMLQNTGSAQEAVREFETSVRLDGENPTALNNLGVAYIAQGKTNDALDLFRRALSLRPDDAASLTNLGNAFLEKNDISEAIRHCRQAVASDGAYADARNCLGISLARGNQLREAAEHLGKAVELNPASMEYEHNLGRVLAADSRFSSALPHFVRAVELSEGKEPLTLDMLAAMYSEVGLHNDAVTTAQRGLDLAISLGDERLSQMFRARIARYQSLAAGR
jgi:Flp pilus assembly protein TadD